MYTESVTNSNSKFFLFSITFGLVFLFPCFPEYFRNSQVHINFIVIAISLLVLLVNNLGNGLKINQPFRFFLLYFLICQILLIPSLLFDSATSDFDFSSFLSFFRPFLLFFSFSSLYVLLQKIELKKIFFILKFLIFLSFFYSIVELYLHDYFYSVIYSLYKREWRIGLHAVSTTFFMTSYYSGFVFFSIFVLFFSKALTEKKVKDFLWCVPIFILIMFAQSKTMIFSTVICLFIAFAFLFRRLFFISFPIVVFSFLTLVVNIDLILVYFDEYNLRVVKQLRELVFNYNESETLAIRLTQIFDSFIMVSHNGGLLGEGLSPKSSLESWVALYLYRYGILGVLNFLFFSVLITFFSLKLYNYKETGSRVVGLALFLWGLTLPITQLSSAMIEFGKTAYVSNFMLALLCSQFYRLKNER